jgi:integrase
MFVAHYRPLLWALIIPGSRRFFCFPWETQKMKGCRPLSKTEVDLLLQDRPPRDKLLILTGLYFGTRISEALKLTFGDVSGGFISIHSAKGSDNVTFGIPLFYKTEVDRLRAEYQAQGVTVTDQTPLFLSRQGKQHSINRIRAHQILWDAKEQCGLEGKVNTHSLRKTFVTSIYQLSNRDIAQTKKYSRHKSLANLDYYIGTTEDLSLVQKLDWGS